MDESEWKGDYIKDWWGVYCNECGAEGAGFKGSKSAATKAWNRRAD